MGRDWAGRSEDWCPSRPPPGSRELPPPFEVRELVRRLEVRALARLEEDLPMSEPAKIDEQHIQEQLAGGKSMTAIAAEVGVARSTISRRLNGKASAPASYAASKPHAAGNGTTGALGELQTFLDRRWAALSVVQKVRMFVDAAPPLSPAASLARAEKGQTDLQG